MAAGIDAANVLIDPGIGFGKTFDHNLELLAHCEELTRIAPVVIGASRKGFIGHLTGQPGGAPRMAGSLAAVAAAHRGGAAIVRVHDVRETVDFLKSAAARSRRGSMSVFDQLFRSVTWRDAVDILIVAFIIYYILSLIRGTRAMQISIGLMLLGSTTFVARAFDLPALEAISRQILFYLPFAIIVLFQQEIRRALARMVGDPLAMLFRPRAVEFPRDAIVQRCEVLASKKIGRADRHRRAADAADVRGRREAGRRSS